MEAVQQYMESWVEMAREKLAEGRLTNSDLEKLAKRVAAIVPRHKQKLMYLHTRDPSVYSDVIGMAEHMPVIGVKDALRTRDSWPYDSVQHAMQEGWQVIHFPQMMAPFDDRELDFVGYEFILQKMVAIDD